MARLPSGQYLIQQTGAQVILFEDYTERQVVRFDPGDGIAVENALDAIRDSGLGDEDRCYACFWAGYFGFHAGAQMQPEAFVREVAEGREVLVTDAGTEIARFDPRDGNASARAQKNIYDSGLSDCEKSRAYAWSGYFYAQASPVRDL